MIRYAFLFLFALTQLVVRAQSSGILSEIQTFEQARYAAILKADTFLLADMLADDLVYTHSNCAVEDKAAYLRAIGSGKYHFEQFATDSTQYRMLNHHTVVATGLVKMKGSASGKAFQLSARFSAVYVCKKRRWLLHTWQTTRF